MQTAPSERVCRMCYTRADLETPESETYVLSPNCPRCLMPYLPGHEAEAHQIESIILSMYAFLTTIDTYGPAIQIITHIAPTHEEIERIRSEIHHIDIKALVNRTRTTENDKLKRLYSTGFATEVESRLLNLLRDAESGLLWWRIDQLCQTALTALEARANHHQRILNGAP